MKKPPFLAMDMRPVTWPLLLVASHEVAEQISKSTKLFPWSVNKSPTVADILHLVGPRSLLAKEVCFYPPRQF